MSLPELLIAGLLVWAVATWFIALVIVFTVDIATGQTSTLDTPRQHEIDRRAIKAGSIVGGVLAVGYILTHWPKS